MDWRVRKKLSFDNSDDERATSDMKAQRADNTAVLFQEKKHFRLTSHYNSPSAGCSPFSYHLHMPERTYLGLTHAQPGSKQAA